MRVLPAHVNILILFVFAPLVCFADWALNPPISSIGEGWISVIYNPCTNEVHYAATASSSSLHPSSKNMTHSWLVGQAEGNPDLATRIITGGGAARVAPEYHGWAGGFRVNLDGTLTVVEPNSFKSRGVNGIMKDGVVDPLMPEANRAKFLQAISDKLKVVIQFEDGRSPIKPTLTCANATGVRTRLADAFKKRLSCRFIPSSTTLKAAGNTAATVFIPMALTYIADKIESSTAVVSERNYTREGLVTWTFGRDPFDMADRWNERLGGERDYFNSMGRDYYQFWENLDAEGAGMECREVVNNAFSDFIDGALVGLESLQSSTPPPTISQAQKSAVAAGQRPTYRRGCSGAFCLTR